MARQGGAVGRVAHQSARARRGDRARARSMDGSLVCLVGGGGRGVGGRGRGGGRGGEEVVAVTPLFAFPSVLGL